MGKKATIDNLLAELEEAGCYPSIYRRGPDAWLARVNRAGRYWDVAETPWLALAKAKLAWEKDGRPMDGMASEPLQQGTQR